jgi:RNA polymerase sigma-70 factor (ECF subfamily)
VEVPNAAQFPDERLRLMLVCAHPAIDESIRTALILQVVLGIEAKRMASVFLLSTEAMTKRLVRAKRKIREAGLRFEEPEPQDLRERLHVLLEAIYAAYVLQSEGEVNTDLASEAIYLARLIADMLPCGESLGFFALLQFIEARRPARVLNDTFIPLLEQDATVWNHAMLDGAYALLARAASYQTTGPFQLEAAIQGAHCHRARSGLVPWHDIAALYALLVASYPTIGSRIAYAVASAHASGDAAKGFALLTSIEASAVRDHQPWWVASAHLHAMAGRTEEAARCFERAIGLTSDARVRKFLHAKREGVLSAAGAAAIAKQSGNVTPT